MYNDDVYRMDESQIDPRLLESFRPKNNKVIVLWIIIIANAVAEVMSLIAGGDTFETGGLNYEYIFNNHEFTRVLTYMFLHANIPHFVNNMVALFLFGQNLEREVGSLKTAIIYFVSGIGAGLFSVCISHIISPDAIRFAAGASGAVFGIMCASLYFTIRNKGDEKTGMITAIVLIVVYAVISNGAQVDIFSHIGGGIFGGVIAFKLGQKESNDESSSNFIAVILTALICVCGVLMSGIGREASQIRDYRIDEVKNQTIFENMSITYGQCLDGNCDDGKWTIFTTADKEKVVEFNGKLYYGGEDSKVKMQFTYSDLRKRWMINYAAVNGSAFKTSNELAEFLYSIALRITG